MFSIRSLFARRLASALTLNTRKTNPILSVQELEDRVTPAPITFPSDNTLFFQTSGPQRAPTVGDWYTTQTSTSTDRVHRFSVEVTEGQLAAAGGSLTVSVLDAESINGPGPVDEVDGASTVGMGTSDPTRFRLLSSSGTTLDTYTINPTAVPANGTITRTNPGGTTISTGVANGTTVTFTAITQPGIYTVTSETGATYIYGSSTANNVAELNNDDNSFQIRVSEAGPSNQTGLIGTGSVHIPTEYHCHTRFLLPVTERNKSTVPTELRPG